MKKRFLCSLCACACLSSGRVLNNKLHKGAWHFYFHCGVKCCLTSGLSHHDTSPRLEREHGAHAVITQTWLNTCGTFTRITNKFNWRVRKRQTKAAHWSLNHPWMTVQIIMTWRGQVVSQSDTQWTLTHASSFVITAPGDDPLYLLWRPSPLCAEAQAHKREMGGVWGRRSVFLLNIIVTEAELSQREREEIKGGSSNGLWRRRLALSRRWRTNSLSALSSFSPSSTTFSTLCLLSNRAGLCSH